MLCAYFLFDSVEDSPFHLNKEYHLAIKRSQDVVAYMNFIVSGRGYAALQILSVVLLIHLFIYLSYAFTFIRTLKLIPPIC